MLADEAFAEKVLTGNTRKIRPCIACNQGCYYRLLEEMKTGSCAVNPSVDYTEAQLPKKTEPPKNILVAGGGLVGCEIAYDFAKDGRTIEIPADDVVISIGFRPVKSMAEEIRALGYEVIEIGDGEKVGNVMKSIWSAFDAAKEI